MRAFLAVVLALGLTGCCHPGRLRGPDRQGALSQGWSRHLRSGRRLLLGDGRGSHRPPENRRCHLPGGAQKVCPRYRQVWIKGSTGFTDGRYTVGGKRGPKPGTYRTWLKPVTDCYWERSTGSGGIIANQLVTYAPQGLTVRLQAGEGFTSRDCGPWVRARRLCSISYEGRRPCRIALK